MRRIILPVFMTAAMAACAQTTHTASERHAMLDEIYDAKIIYDRTQRNEINGIVLKYLPIGTSKETALAFLGGLGEGEANESGNTITYATHKGEGYKANRRDIRVEIKLDSSGNIESLTSFIDKSNNL
ncbi:hypothetical protein [Hydrogenophaga sp. 5NK40-0174]|uniref:hypothetical protein n=1 Tax=Hydrogenophaga sp. 5NK40-0174 TaxID=3127649 RepID=UPI0031048FD0